MLPYPPNGFQSVTVPRPHKQKTTCNFQYLYRSSFHSRTMGDLTQSVSVHPIPENGTSLLPQEPSRLFYETVHVVPKASGGYRVLQPNSSAHPERRTPTPSTSVKNSGHQFSHNIKNQDMQQRLKQKATDAKVHKNISRSLQIARSSVYADTRADGITTVSVSSIDKEELNKKRNTLHESLLPSSIRGERVSQCTCQFYHSHTFQGRPVNSDILRETQQLKETLAKSTSKETDVWEDNNDDFRNIFWTPSLSFHPYQHGDKLVEFTNLWPSLLELRQHFQNSGIQHTVIRDLAILDLCKLAIVCGPIRLLRCLVELQLVRVDQKLDNGAGMLHLAVLAQNTEAVQYLTATKISPRLQDKSGSTVDQVCFNSAVKRHLPPKYLLHREARQSSDGRMVPIKPSLQDKDVIFKLATNPKNFDEIQKKLQTLDFNVNTECDSSGDFLLHIVCRRGLSQLPLMMALVKIQGADVELCNAEGLTALMLAASAGNCVLCDVLMCLFGADPNKPNPNTGRTALHYAVEGNHRKTVECLIRRGADVNVEDLLGRRPDDVPLCPGVNDDCREVITFTRTRRIETLTDRIRKGELEKNHLLKSDLYVVDEEGYTLVMTAAIYNRAQELEVLLQSNDTTINAQHTKTGMTALAIAAEMGNTEAVQVLLSHGANPAIADMKSYLPLHHAVLNNQEKVVDAMLEYFPLSYCGLFKAARLCKRTSIHVKLKSAFTRRQEELVTPKLLACTMSGAADELFQLLDDGDIINPKSSTGNWPLYLAVENGHLDIVRLLFEQGGDIRKRHSTTGETVLHIAARMGHTEIMRYLLSFCQTAHSQLSAQRHTGKMLDINTLDANNRTSLQVAAEKGYSKIVELLLQHGATTALLDAEGQLVTCPQYEGVRVQIETHRQLHTKDVVAAITERSRKALEQLKKIWLPRFDHNLRTSQGDTPLMVACSTGKLQILKFLLESAVYPQSQQDYEHEEDSDADSGVLDPAGSMAQRHRSKSEHEELQNSGTFAQSAEVQQSQLTISGDLAHSGDAVSEKKGPLESQPTGAAGVQQYLQDVSRPKGLYIYHDGLVSHVCAMNIFDGSTALHRAIEHGDDYQAVRQLLIADPACLNLQNSLGMSPLHLACRLGRKKVLEMLLATEGIDINARTLEGLLPEEMVTSKSIVRLVEKAREQLTGRITASLKSQETMPRDDDSSASQSLAGSVVNFDSIHKRYEDLRNEMKDVS